MFEYGIGTSIADLWAHVIPSHAAIYVYEPREMLNYIENHNPRRSTIRSAIGYLVPNGCPFIQRIELPREWFIGKSWKTDEEAGRFCEEICAKALSKGYFRFRVQATFVTNVEEQRSGYDFNVTLSARVEAKADIRGGETGNLFVQTHEQNHDWRRRNSHREEAA